MNSDKKIQTEKSGSAKIIEDDFEYPKKPMKKKKHMPIFDVEPIKIVRPRAVPEDDFVYPKKPVKRVKKHMPVFETEPVVQEVEFVIPKKPRRVVGKEIMANLISMIVA